MSRAILVVLLAAVAGCSDADKTAAGLTAFIESCDAPVQGTLTTSTFNNKLVLTCPQFKPMTKAEVTKGAPTNGR